MTIEEINALLEPFLAPDSLSPEQSMQVRSYLELLLKWNAKVNLTAIRSQVEIVQRHFGESFFAARQLTKIAPNMASAADVGSGAGFPGFPLKIWRPEINLTLIESNGKKAAFLHEASRVLGLKDVEVVTDRAENLTAKYGLVTLRAVEHFERILPIVFRLVERHGIICLLIGEPQLAIAKNLLPHLTWDAAAAIPLSNRRVVLIGRS